ncbi:hypothetical protein PR048_030943 [Dryococelus australis]|uniref:Uncharacterized protein n=1 Tax=Dryococelus australis TaxID=614101 RepID=A0ABQ9GD48_9NEOP|nr:hypothetical protein PR048_030943 [Dryococelus australis]
MFGDSEIAKFFTLGSTKVAYEICPGLGPYFHLELVKSIKSSNNFFTLSFDAGNKQLDINKLLDSLSRDTLSLKKLLPTGSDGLPVKEKCLCDLDSHLKSEGCHGLINIGTCNFHWEIYDFLDVLFKFIHKFPATKECFANIQIELGIKQQTMLRFVNNRWLSMVPAMQESLSSGVCLSPMCFTDASGKYKAYLEDCKEEKSEPDSNSKRKDGVERLEEDIQASHCLIG